MKHRWNTDQLRPDLMQCKILSVGRAAFFARSIDLQAIIRVSSVAHFSDSDYLSHNLYTAPRNRRYIEQNHRQVHGHVAQISERESVGPQLEQLAKRSYLLGDLRRLKIVHTFKTQLDIQFGIVLI